MTQRKKDEIRILVVDDEPGLRDFLSYELGSQGYQISTVGDGAEAVALVRGNPEAYDLVISDMKMPKMDGVTMLEEIKKINPRIEIIMATGFGTIETAVSAMKKGAYDFVQKPYNVEEISAIVEKALEKNELRTLIALYESSRAVFSTVNLKDLLILVMDLIQKGLAADEGTMMFLNEKNELYIASSTGVVDETAKQVSLKIGERIAGRVAQERLPLLLIGGLSKYPEFSGIETNPRIISAIVIPILHQDELLGVLTLNRVGQRANFNSSDLQHACIFATQLAQAVKNARLFNELEGKVTELKSAYKLLDDAKEKIVETEKLVAIGRLVSGVAHEINNPLTSVLGYTELLLGSDVRGRMKEDLQIVLQEAQRCQKIVQNLLLFARRQSLSLERSNIEALLDQSLNSLSMEFKKHSVEVVKKISECPAVMVDAGQIQQVFLNIMRNACQALEAVPSGRCIEITLAPTSPKMVRIIFADNGPGISKEHKDKIFDPFFTTKAVGKGTGLGLSLSYGIIHRHGGTILVESEQGKGCAFIIDLPVVSQNTTDVEAAAVRSMAVDMGSKGKKVLLVEDDEMIRLFLARLLLSHGLAVETVTDGAAACSKILKENFDLILCDYLLPYMNGQKVYEKISKEKPQDAEKFIFVSGCSADKDFDDFLKEKNLTRVTKPFVPETLLKAISEKLR